MLFLLAEPEIWCHFNKDGQRGKTGIMTTELPTLLLGELYF